MNDKDRYDEIDCLLKQARNNLQEASGFSEELDDPKQYPILDRDTGDRVGWATIYSLIREALAIVEDAREHALKEVYGE